jgi:hypothetical protein
MLDAILQIDVIAGALLGAAVVLIILLVFGVNPLLIAAGVAIGALGGGYYGRLLGRQLRRLTGGRG